VVQACTDSYMRIDEAYDDQPPPSLTIWQTAAAPATQVFMLMGTLVLLPIIFGYMIFVYWTFGGKLREGEGYH
jgi:cytochrome bd ubiquinol oxidase subunit II